jgi:hypothetical protein
MSAITLDDIKATQAKLATMIAAFERQSAFPVTIAPPDLEDGEVWLGAIVSADGRKREHVILLPGDSDPKRWKEQMAWAESLGGELPDRVEGALLFATLKDEFREEAYWTREQHAVDSDYAWCQNFGDGNQYSSGTDYKLRARAVRRVPIE